MPLREEFESSGQWLFRWRSYLPVVLLVPVIILLSWKGVIDKLGAAFALSTCITIGLVAIGLMGYSNSIARDRDKGVFQRLRVAPMPSWCIMASRLAVQVAMILLLTIIVFLFFSSNYMSYSPVNKVRLVTAASLFDGHDAAINIMRRIMQSKGAEIIHLGHNRSVAEIVECAIEEDVQGIDHQRGDKD